MNWFDFVLLGIMVIYTVSGFRQGLVKQLFNLFGFVIVLVLALVGSKYLSGYIAAYLKPELLVPYQEVIRLLGAETAMEQVLALVAGVLAFIILFVVLLLLFRLLSGGLKWVNKIPVLGFFNRLGGAVLGLLIGVVFAYIAISVLSLVPVRGIMEAVAGSYLAGTVEMHCAAVTAWLKSLLLGFYLNTIQNGGALP